mgnify:CR=1 FL=1
MKKKKILIIGGSGSISNAIGEFLSKSFFLISSSRNKPEYKSDYLYLDLNEKKSIKEFCKNFKNKFKTIDGIIFASGKTIGPKKNSKNKLQSPKIFKNLMNVNLISFYEIIFELEENLSNNASIILISSLGAHHAFPNNPGYQVSKAGLESLSRSLSYDLSYKDVRVNSLALGYFKTNMTRESFNDKNFRKERTDRTILKRWGDPEEINGIINLLLSDSSSYITGSTIFIDGGWHTKGL